MLSAHGLTPDTQTTYVLPGPPQDHTTLKRQPITPHSLTTRCHDVDHDTGGRTCLHSMHRSTVYLRVLRSWGVYAQFTSLSISSSESSIFLPDLLLFVLLQIALFIAAVRDLLPVISLLVPPTPLDVGNNRLKGVDWNLLAPWPIFQGSRTRTPQQAHLTHRGRVAVRSAQRMRKPVPRLRRRRRRSEPGAAVHPGAHHVRTETGQRWPAPKISAGQRTRQAEEGP